MTPPAVGPAPDLDDLRAGAPESVRERLVLALDVGDVDAAIAVARRLAPWFGVAKVGLELYGYAGPDAFARVRDLGFRVFADLKLHDIPNTVGRACYALGRQGVDFANFHAAGGEAMLRAAVEGLRDGARDGGHAAPVDLAVTVLTSDPDTTAFTTRLGWAAAAGCTGVVCSAWEVAQARGAGLRTMVPGVRLAGADRHDQARVATPEEVLANGGDWVVVGRAVTAAADPELAAAQVAASARAGLAAV